MFGEVLRNSVTKYNQHILVETVKTKSDIFFNVKQLLKSELTYRLFNLN